MLSLIDALNAEEQFINYIKSKPSLTAIIIFGLIIGKQIPFVKKLIYWIVDIVLCTMLKKGIEIGLKRTQDGSTTNELLVNAKVKLNEYLKSKGYKEIEDIKHTLKENVKQIREGGVFTKYKHPRDVKIRPVKRNRKKYFTKHIRKIVKRSNIHSVKYSPRRNLDSPS